MARSVSCALQNVWFFFKIASGCALSGAGPLFSVLGASSAATLSTVTCGDMVWTDAILALLWWQLQQPPA